MNKEGVKNNIKAIYEVTINYVRKYREQSEEFVTKEGLQALFCL